MCAQNDIIKTDLLENSTINIRKKTLWKLIYPTSFVSPLKSWWILNRTAEDQIYVFCAVHFGIIIQHEPNKIHIS